MKIRRDKATRKRHKHLLNSIIFMLNDVLLPGESITFSRPPLSDLDNLEAENTESESSG